MERQKVQGVHLAEHKPKFVDSPPMETFCFFLFIFICFHMFILLSLGFMQGLCLVHFFFNSSGVRHIVEILQIFIELNLLLSFELKKKTPDLVHMIFVFFPLKAGGK